MSSAEDLTDGNSVDWSGVATAVVGTWATAMFLFAIDVVGRVGSAVEWVLTGAVGYYALVVEGLLGIPGSVLGTAWDSAAAFVGTLGVFGLPVSVLITFSAMWVLYVTLETFVFGGDS